MVYLLHLQVTKYLPVSRKNTLTATRQKQEDRLKKCLIVGLRFQWFMMVTPLVSGKLLLGHDNPINVTTQKVPKYNARIERQDFKYMRTQEIKRNSEIIKCICHTMRKTTHDEQWHTKKQWQILALTREGNHRRHDETTPNGKDTTTQRPHCQTALKNIEGCLL